MSLTGYSCIIPGEIDIIVSDDYFADFSQMQFCIVKKYEKLYEKEYDRFKDIDYTPYALPGKSKNIRIYSGLDREPNEFTPDNIDEYSIEKVLDYYKSLDNQDTELIYYRIDGYEKEVPKGLKFIGDAIAYLYHYLNQDFAEMGCFCIYEIYTPISNDFYDRKD